MSDMIAIRGNGYEISNYTATNNKKGEELMMKKVVITFLAVHTLAVAVPFTLFIHKAKKSTKEAYTPDY